MALFLAFLASGFSTLIILFILAIFILLNQDIKIPASKTFSAALIVLLLIVALDFGDDLLAGKTSYLIHTIPIEKIVQYRTITSALLYMLRPVVILLELMIVAPSQRIKIPCITIALINAAVYAPALFGSRAVFWIDQDNQWHGEMLHYSVYIVQIIYVALLYFFTMIYFNNDDIKRSILLLAIVFLAIVSVFLEHLDLLPGRVTQITAICTLAYYLYLTSISYHEMRVQVAESKLKMEQDKMTILRNQIQPHFIYNSLSIIQTLVQTDPNNALDAIEHFSDYLKAHFQAIRSEHMIGFDQELENVRAYLALAQADYTRKVDVIYDLQELDFRVPQLSLEPIVENAIKHGTGPNSGTITISTRSMSDSYVISVSDSGKGGYDLTEKQKKRLGVGIANTRSRLASLCGGTLEMEKQTGGTVIRITIPKNSQETEAEIQ
ncbi:MAG: histidine kinase [Oscillospiraceae bacterium]|nr:histidine kinase [Oscillospiraceae bacterium]